MVAPPYTHGYVNYLIYIYIYINIINTYIYIWIHIQIVTIIRKYRERSRQMDVCLYIRVLLHMSCTNAWISKLRQSFKGRCSGLLTIPQLTLALWNFKVYPTWMCVSASKRWSSCVSMHMYTCTQIYPSIHPSILSNPSQPNPILSYPPHHIHWSIYLSIQLLLYPPTYLSTYLFIHLPIYPPTYLSILTYVIPSYPLPIYPSIHQHIHI